MEKNQRSYHKYDFYIVALLFIACSCIPFSLFIKDNNLLISGLCLIVQFLFLGCLLFYFYKKRLNAFKSEKPFNFKALLILLPTLVVTVSNYFVLPTGYTLVKDPNIAQLLFLLILNLFIVINEELIFRFFALDLYKSKSLLFKLLIPSLIFAIAHLSRFLSTFNPFDLIAVAYSFGLGILLNIFYIFTNSIYPCFILHFLFNALNDVIFSSLFSYSSKSYFVIINIIIAVVVLIYLLILYVINRKVIRLLN